MATDDTSEIVIQRMYRIFHIKDENYVTTIKLVYIYNWIAPKAEDVTFDLIADLRKILTDESNDATLERLYRQLKLITLNQCGRYDTNTRGLPMQKSHYERGWHPYYN